MSTTASIHGTVVDTNDYPLPGVTVNLTSSSLTLPKNTVTLNDGTFNFRDLPPGSYTIEAIMTGMRTVKTEERLGLGQTAKPILVMQPDSTHE